MAGDEDDMEDISMTTKEIAKVTKMKADAAKSNPSSTYQIVCPDCGCDYLIPLYVLHFTKSFAGNRLTTTWPSREGTDDTALVACPICADVIRVTNEGKVEKTQGKWTVREKKVKSKK
jgi:hypothetical protein